MYSFVSTGALNGIESYLATVEVDASTGLPGFEMVGMLNAEIKEAKERVRVALKNSGITMPPLRITVNISPANLRKNGTSYDLPIAIGLLIAIGELSQECVKDIVIIGELGLNGEVKFTNGILPMVLQAKAEGMKTCLVPKENAEEGAVVEGIDIIGVSVLAEVIEYLKADEEERKIFYKTKVDLERLMEQSAVCDDCDFSEISGQEYVKKAVETAAAGFHHVLLIGSPGAGKTMSAKRIPSVLPPLSLEDSMEVSKIYSISGLLNERQALITKRPFCSPHHTISEQAFAGGGRIPKPGMVSLAHKGVLFLDEVVHFSNPTIEVLRQPMEDKKVQIARSYGTFTYPADFMLVAAMNPCPCGYFPDRNRCTCNEAQVRRYLSPVSGPILDRIDICVEVARMEMKDLEKKSSVNSTIMRERIGKARKIQQLRFQGAGISFNAQMGPNQIKEFCVLGSKEKSFVEQAFNALKLSARAYHKILKVARTIADLDGSDNICEEHLAGAIAYRSVDRKYW
ncbi:MAG: YifB family Mg chelatase-like AAA ATPase [Lachnospiraceae bacterium]|nr:YifB family Mg chelatase-like AAA ATPase [Lachnospiraceae bacterium]